MVRYGLGFQPTDERPTFTWSNPVAAYQSANSIDPNVDVASIESRALGSAG